MLSWLKNLTSHPEAAPATPEAKPADAPQRSVTSGGGVRMMRARFDSAITTDENRRHWAYADGLSPTAALSTQVRQILRNRARYEVANNSYAKGIVLTLANDVIGTGPRLPVSAAVMKPQPSRWRKHEDWLPPLGGCWPVRCGTIFAWEILGAAVAWYVWGLPRDHTNVTSSETNAASDPHE